MSRSQVTLSLKPLDRNVKPPVKQPHFMKDTPSHYRNPKFLVIFDTFSHHGNVELEQMVSRTTRATCLNRTAAKDQRLKENIQFLLSWTCPDLSEEQHVATYCYMCSDITLPWRNIWHFYHKGNKQRIGAEWSKNQLNWSIQSASSNCKHLSWSIYNKLSAYQTIWVQIMVKFKIFSSANLIWKTKTTEKQLYPYDKIQLWW